MEDLRQSLTGGPGTALTDAARPGRGGQDPDGAGVCLPLRPGIRPGVVGAVRGPRHPGGGLRRPGRAAGLAGEGAAEQEVKVAAVRQWLRQRGKWLLIFDNAGEPQDLTDYLPQAGGGQVLITSRNPAWRGVARPWTSRSGTAASPWSFCSSARGGRRPRRRREGRGGPTGGRTGGPAPGPGAGRGLYRGVRLLHRPTTWTCSGTGGGNC